MDMQVLTNFFMWCTIINGGVLILLTLGTMFLPNIVYKSQYKWFPLQRDTYNAIMYLFIGLFKVIFIVFNLTPFLVLLIIGI